MWTHATTETMLANSGLAWTAVRNGFYADAALRFMGTDWQQGRIAAPADGKVAWTTHLDALEVTVRLLPSSDTTTLPVVVTFVPFFIMKSNSEMPFLVYEREVELGSRLTGLCRRTCPSTPYASDFPCHRCHLS
jgi:hypothetical protein